MIARRFHATGRVVALLSLPVASIACAPTPSVEGEVALAQRDATTPLLLIRVFPDHPDGFDPHRIYKGDGEFGSEVVRVDDVDFPYAFRFEQPEEPQPSGARWRVLAWLAADPHARWIHPGETFGTQSFEFVHVPHGASYADGLVVELGETAPP
jgi:hypothetical protein